MLEDYDLWKPDATFKQYFSYISAVSFIGGGHGRKSQIYRMSLTPCRVLNLTTLVMLGTDYTGRCKSN
jgi:hypothetical protein